MSHAIYWLNVGDNALIRQYEARYSELGFSVRPSLAILEDGAEERLFKDCCSVWRELTQGRGYKRFYDGKEYRTTEGTLDDMRNEGHESRIAMALAGLPVYTKVSGK